MTQLSIIILSYNVERLLLGCLASLYGAKKRSDDWEIIVIDNASSDNSVAQVKKHFPKVKLIVNKTNTGFAAGNNFGIKKSSGKYVLLLNPDTLVYANSISSVLNYMQSHPKVGAATCRVELPDGSLDYSCHRGFPNPTNSFLHFVGFKKLSSYTSQYIPNYPHEIDALTGAFAFIRRQAGRQAGWLDEDYFWNGEDIDFCYKLKENGWQVVYIPEIKITHYKGASAMATKDTRLAWAKNSTGVMSLFYRKHLAQKYPFFVNWSVYLGIWILKLFRLIRS
ncbi:hypothetical protein A2634_03750 [Candidatus Amesbacteria bacterium RIFCSPHIGHO2_01_FULL_48_32]|uniref:Glycosyltransferase 2-like domain-containing protein n=1 Tax=Candidatus Amesbacteria bacterium RIFCSPLOWO2_01_FULL_48_25 TaxID=1797259 RepID=A0A1F4ZBA2_9BACT|nr:MAG: hypothetical protein A2634_03750 [Candidatus Amesbacteria bacterium RIFCSPHIGHO2_01_FULL_48_32]OGD03471.1 MAG: hypothetical protein A2989_02480 [Candidatus Amesbacteria bacterium RIFCSPLOWO2_01_FULL_48_25]HJZ05777.1 glycosyltransferase family 2 protein [Patescibacteria group bacterium]